MRLILFMLVIALAACNQQDMMQSLASPDDQAAAKAYIELLRSRDFGALAFLGYHLERSKTA